MIFDVSVRDVLEWDVYFASWYLTFIKFNLEPINLILLVDECLYLMRTVIGVFFRLPERVQVTRRRYKTLRIGSVKQTLRGMRSNVVK